jgi:hypothetical protein
MSGLTSNRRYVFSAPASVSAHAEGRDGVLNPREALDWRRSG